MPIKKLYRLNSSNYPLTQFQILPSLDESISKKGAVLLVIMKVNLHNKNIVAIFLAYPYNDVESLPGEASFEPLTERVSS
jgi:hypothetical protein